MNSKLTITGKITYTADIDNFLAAKVIALIEQGSLAPAENTHTPQAELLSGGDGGLASRFSGRSLIQAFEETSAKKKPQMLTVAGYRAMEESGEQSFTAKQVIEQFRSAGINTKNLDRDIKKAISAGLIFSETGNRGNYKVTELAVAAFEKGFDQIKVPSRTNTSTVKTSRQPVKLEVSEEVQQLSIEATMKEYPDYHSVAKKGDRIIWLLIFAAKNGIPSLNSKEIEYLSRELRDQITSSSVSPLTKSSTKKGYIARSGSKYRLLHRGDTLIKEQHSDQGGA